MIRGRRLAARGLHVDVGSDTTLARDAADVAGVVAEEPRHIGWAAWLRNFRRNFVVEDFQGARIDRLRFDCCFLRSSKVIARFVGGHFGSFAYRCSHAP